MALDPKILTAITTEHFGLAGARSQAASESASRSALYLGSVSSALVGLGLMATVSGGNGAFYVFALVALPTLFALGVFTFVRLVELGIEDFLLGRAINRIRHLYIEEAGEYGRYFLLSGNDDADGVLANMGLSPSNYWLLYFTVAVSVATVNSVIGGSAVALAVSRATGAGLLIDVLAGAAFAIASLTVALRFQNASRGTGSDLVLFPSERER